MLHAERLTRILVDEAVAELLLEQAKKHPERRDVLERWLERAEPRCRHLVDEITSTGDRLLAKLRGEAVAAESRRGEDRMSVSLQVHSLSGAGVARDGRGGGRRAQAATRRRRTSRRSRSLPGREHHLTVSPRPAELVNAYVRWVGGDPASYKGRVPAHLFPQWGFPLTGKLVEGLKYPMLAAMNGGCKLTINSRCPPASRSRSAAGSTPSTTTGTRAILDQKIVTGTRSRTRRRSSPTSTSSFR